MLETREEIEDWLIHHNINGYTIQDDLTVDVANSVYLFGEGNPLIYDFNRLEDLPVQFGVVQGEFWISDNNLKTLKGCPRNVEGAFICYNNNLTSLEGAPEIVKGKFDCSYNQLTSLAGAPRSVEGTFDCSYNKLTSLNGAPQNVLHSFLCANNELETLNGAPVSIKGGFVCTDNPLRSLGGIDTYIGTDFTSAPVAEIDCISRHDYAGNYHVNAEDFNAKVQEFKRIREEKALFESSIAKVFDTPPLGSTTPHTAEPQQQARVKPKFKL